MSVQGLKHLRLRSGIPSILNSRASYRPSSTLRPGQHIHHPSAAASASRSRTFTATATMKFTPPSEEPPKHEMVYFPNMTTSLPSESGEFRRVLWTGLYSQLVLMTVPVDGEIGDEKHTVDQILTFTSGSGKATINGKDQDVKAGDLIIVPAGTQHQFINTGPTPLILYTVYSPAEHKPTSVHKDKEQGDREEEEGIDVAPEWSQRSKAENEKLGLVEPEDH
ncbi:RmlC-like cupin domain-containing protein [Exophiala viscosa]|uniref:RmlC-like cupin domain-containing protein n=1 Tax=Exophiala viscosa TaxID=2486360 RepID=A0AAN6DQC5_9EURO|nr:RmlC-like cupin domain-containing protein [Exophiala viscosa]KAI1625380.1 RmlC-like cupin domain-containing protein [Exophiala viscosa]